MFLLLLSVFLKSVTLLGSNLGLIPLLMGKGGENKAGLSPGDQPGGQVTTAGELGCWLPSGGGASVGTGHPSTTSLCDLEQPVDVQGTVSGPLWASGLTLKGRRRAALPKNKATGN